MQRKSPSTKHNYNTHIKFEQIFFSLKIISREVPFFIKNIIVFGLLMISEIKRAKDPKNKYLLSIRLRVCLTTLCKMEQYEILYS